MKQQQSLSLDSPRSDMSSDLCLSPSKGDEFDGSEFFSFVVQKFIAQQLPEISAAQGEEVQILCPPINNWVYVQKENGEEGYVPQLYLSVFNDYYVTNLPSPSPLLYTPRKSNSVAESTNESESRTEPNQRRRRKKKKKPRNRRLCGHTADGRSHQCILLEQCNSTSLVISCHQRYVPFEKDIYQYLSSLVKVNDDDENDEDVKNIVTSSFEMLMVYACPVLCVNFATSDIRDRILQLGNTHTVYNVLNKTPKVKEELKRHDIKFRVFSSASEFIETSEAIAVAAESET